MVLVVSLLALGCAPPSPEIYVLDTQDDVTAEYGWPLDGGIEKYYQNPMTRDMVVDFFNGYTKSPYLTELILSEAVEQGVSPALAFALVWAESSYNSTAVNQNSSSVDRGLFQLNNRSFPHLTEAEFFDPAINAKTGISYLKKCLERGGNEVVALAMYNAGSHRVTRGGTPQMTLNYIDKILDFKGDLEDSFQVALIKTPVKAAYQSKAHKKVKLLLDRKNSLN